MNRCDLIHRCGQSEQVRVAIRVLRNRDVYAAQQRTRMEAYMALAMH